MITAASVSQSTPPSVAALATASIKATIQDDTTQLYIHPLNSLSILFSFLTLQAWPTVKRTFELYPGAAMPYNEHRISGKIASMCGTRVHGVGGGTGRAVRKCAGKLLAKSLCQVPPPPLAEYDALFRELRVTSDEFTTLTKCLHFGRNCLLNCFSSRLVKCVFPVSVRLCVCMSVRVLSPTLTAQHMRNLFA